jgi:hypothetical protein
MHTHTTSRRFHGWTNRLTARLRLSPAAQQANHDHHQPEKPNCLAGQAGASIPQGETGMAKLSEGDTVGMTGTIVHDDGTVTIRLHGYDVRWQR